MLAKMADLIETLVVYPERMRQNLESSGGLVFSGQLLLDLVESGTLTREDAYRIVQRNAMKAWRDGANFRELIEAEPEIASRISRKQIERAFDLNRQLRNVDKIFVRVFGEENGGGRKVSRKQGARPAK
jgi:adenylosuccinate lyase